MSTNGKLTPKLRFPEFRNAGDWEEKILSNITPAIFDGTHQTPTYTEAGIPFYSVENLISGNANKFISKEDYDLATRKNKPEKGDILLTRIGKIGFSQVVTWDHEFSVYVTLAVIKRLSQFDSHYLHCLMQSDFYQSELRSKSLSNAVPPKINMDSLRETKVILPSSAEQRKIADCLSSLDELIAAEGRKWESLRAYKKGLMQQLFPRDGETTPRLRFPEFRKGPGWENQTISSILSKVANPVAVESNEMYREIGIRSHGKGIFHKEPISGNAIGDKRVFWVVQDAFVVNIIFAWEQAVATTSQAEAGMIASHRFPMYVAKEGKCDVKFISRIFQSKKGKYLLGVASPGGAGRNRTLGQKEFEKLEIIVPEKVEEQRKIADCLSSLDSQIAVQSERLDALRAHKKGLMQQLFPTAGEI